MKVKLTVTEGTEKGKAFSFDEPENFLLGRTAEGSKAHLRLSPDDTYVSRNHFLLEINPPDCFIRDAEKPISIGKKVSGLPARLVSTIDLAIEKNIKKRIQTAEEFGKAIEGFAK